MIQLTALKLMCRANELKNWSHLAKAMQIHSRFLQLYLQKPQNK